jgi:hypothetical protein
MNTSPSGSWPPRYLTPVPEECFGKRGEVAIEFVENYGIITKDSIAGDTEGQPLVLREWQKGAHQAHLRRARGRRVSSP